MNPKTELIIFSLIWFAVTGVIVVKSWKREFGSSLAIFYIANLSLIHCLGTVIYVLPWYGYGDIDATLKGFRIATYGIIAFGIGNIIIAPYLVQLFHIRLSDNVTVVDTVSISNFPKIYLLIGIICYFVFYSFVGRLPTISALVSVGQQLVLIGIFLACWKAWIEKNKKGLITYLLFSVSFPFITIIFQGFLGVGVTMTLMIYLFSARFFRPKWKVIVTGLLFIYLGLTLYQSYMRDRNELRATIWGGAPVVERVEVLGTTLSNTEWFNPFNVKQLERIDDRLNQNFLVGKAVDYLKIKDYAKGKTLWDSVIALIPRIIWPDKPVRAGSPGIVSEYTGLAFAPDTSVGVGQVMEFYINFGITCVIIGFLVLGIVVALIDTMAGYNLLKGNWPRFALWIIPGLAFLQVGGSLVEVTSSAGAGVVVAYFVSKFRSAHYPVLLALLYLFSVSYIGFKYILPIIYPYGGMFIFMAIIAIVVIILARKKSLGL